MKSLSLRLDVLSMFFVRGIGAILAFLLAIIVSKYYGSHGAGVFFTYLGIINIVSTLVLFGYDTKIIKDVAHVSKSEIYGLYIFVIRFILVVSIALFVIAKIVLSLLNDYAFLEVFNYISLETFFLNIVSLAIVTFTANILRGMLFVVTFQVLRTMLIPLLCIIFFVLMKVFFDEDGVKEFINLYFISISSTMLCGLFLVNMKIRQKDISLSNKKNTLSLDNIRFFVISILTITFNWLDVLIISLCYGFDVGGVYSISSRIIQAVNMIYVVINNYIQPRFAHFFKKEEYKSLVNSYKYSQKLLVLAGVVMFIVLVSFGKEIMSLFGSEFEGGVIFLYILNINMLVNFITGNSVSLLLMTNRHGLVMKVMGITAIFVTTAMCVAVYSSLSAIYVASIFVLFLSVQNMVFYFSARKIINSPYATA